MRGDVGAYCNLLRGRLFLASNARAAKIWAPESVLTHTLDHCVVIDVRLILPAKIDGGAFLLLGLISLWLT